MKKFGILAFWIVGVTAVALAGFQPNPYIEKVRAIAAPHAYPLSNVLIIIATMTAFAATSYAVLRPTTYLRSWGRALVCACISLALLAMALLASMHAPLHITVFQVWIALATVFFLMLAVTSCVASYQLKRHS
jgi:hypothetical protein